MTKAKKSRASIEEEARAWAREQRHEPTRLSPLAAYFRRNPSALRFVDLVTDENKGGATASWPAILGHLVANYGLSKHSKADTLCAFFRRRAGGA